MILRAFLLVLLAAAAAVCGLAQAQQYRWVDQNGKTQFSDAPPPPGAKDVRKTNFTTLKPAAPALPFELARLQKDFPVTLYTAPNCKELCEQARGALNKRSVPFTEIQVWNDETVQQLKKVVESDHLPALVIGRSVLVGFDQGQFDNLLNSAGYPAAGAYPARTQGAPALPEGYVQPGATAAEIPAKAAQKSAPAQSSGPYDTSGLTGPAPKPGQYDSSGLTGPAPKPGQYDPSGLTGPPPKPGQYGVPAERK